MSQQGLRQASVRTVTGTALDYNGDFHALFDIKGVPVGDFDGRMLAWLNIWLSASYDNLPGAMAAFAIANGATNFSAVGTFDAGAGGGGGGYPVGAVTIDGLTYYVNSNFECVDSPDWSCAFWAKVSSIPIEDTSAAATIWSSDAIGTGCKYTYMTVLANPKRSVIAGVSTFDCGAQAALDTNSNQFNLDEWVTVFLWTTNVGGVYTLNGCVNDTVLTNLDSPISPITIGMNGLPFYVGTVISGTQEQPTDLAEFCMFMGESIDFSDVSKRRWFRGADGKPVNILTSGAPVPTIYLHQPAGDNDPDKFGLNTNGTSSAFTNNGATIATTSPSD